MKIRVLSFIILSALFFSCKKDHKPSGPSAGDRSVKFTVSGFTKLTGTFDTGKKIAVTSTLSDQVRNMTYLVFDSDGKAVAGHNQIQSSTASNFGVFTDKLPAGTYTIVIGAGQQWFSLSSGNTLSSTIAYYVNTGTASYPSLVFGDTFIKTFSITISDSDVNQDITLNRIVAGLQVNIEDQIPSDAYYVKIAFKDYFRYQVSPPTPILNKDASHTDGYINANNVFTLTAAQKGATNVKFSVILLNTIAPFDVNISCTNQAGTNTYGQIVVKNVTCEANKTTILTGKLFGGAATGDSFSTKIDTVWNPPTVVNF